MRFSSCNNTYYHIMTSSVVMHDKAQSSAVVMRPRTLVPGRVSAFQGNEADGNSEIIQATHHHSSIHTCACAVMESLNSTVMGRRISGWTLHLNVQFSCKPHALHVNPIVFPWVVQPAHYSTHPSGYTRHYAIQWRRWQQALWCRDSFVDKTVLRHHIQLTECLNLPCSPLFTVTSEKFHTKARSVWCGYFEIRDTSMHTCDVINGKGDCRLHLGEVTSRWVNRTTVMMRTSRSH